MCLVDECLVLVFPGLCLICNAVSDDDGLPCSCSEFDCEYPEYDRDAALDLDFEGGCLGFDSDGLSGTEYDNCPNGEEPADVECDFLMSTFRAPLPSKGMVDKKLFASSSIEESTLTSTLLYSPTLMLSVVLPSKV